MSKILYIEDDLVINKIAEVNFKAKGIEVVIAESGEKAIESLKGDVAYNAFIIDLKLPGMTGLEVIKKLKSDPKTRDIPCIVVTGYIRDDSVREAEDMGAICLNKIEYIGMALVDKALELVPSLRPSVPASSQ